MFADMDFEVNQLSDLPEAAASLLAHYPTDRIFLFFGDMGSGKTTFIKSLCAELGVSDAVASPTYSIVNEYQSPRGKIYHFDFYRLKNETEALDMGYEEYFYDGNYCFIEWPEKIQNLWPHSFVKVNIAALDQYKRYVKVDAVK